MTVNVCFHFCPKAHADDVPPNHKIVTRQNSSDDLYIPRIIDCIVGKGHERGDVAALLRPAARSVHRRRSCRANTRGSLSCAATDTEKQL